MDKSKSEKRALWTNVHAMAMHGRRRFAKTASIAVLPGLFIAFCVTLTPVVVRPPHVEGVEFVRAASCMGCRVPIEQDFKHASHSQLQVRGKNAAHRGCEVWHGPGSLHRFTVRVPGTIEFSCSGSDDQTIGDNNDFSGYGVC